MFPLFQYLTKPPAEPNPNAAVGNAVSALGHLGTLNQEKAQLAEHASEFNRSNDLANRAESRYAGEQQFERQKTKAALVDEYNKKVAGGDYAGAAAMAPQMSMLGLSPKILPDAGTEPEPAQPEAPSAKPIPEVPSVQPYKAQPVPPLLSRYMANQPQTPEPPAEPVISDKTAAAAPTSSRLPVYEFIDTETGKSYGVVDPNKAKAQNIEAAGRIGAGFTEGLPEAVRPLAEGATGPAETPAEQKFAVENEKDIILQGMRSAAKHGGGGNPGAFPIGKEAHALQTEIRTTMQAAATDQKVADSNKTLNNITQGLAGLQEGGTVAERGAVAQLIKSAFPGAISDQERGYITEANGIQGKIANALGYWVESGHMDPQLVAQVKRLQELSAEITRERLANAATEVAENWGRTHPELSEQAKEAYIQEGMSLHSPEAAKRRRESKSPKAAERPEFLK